jgi:hypothetical protein
MALTNILVKDDATTPTEFTLVPISDNPVTYRASVAGVPLSGQPRLIVSEPETLKSGDLKITVKLEVPVMETLGASGTSAGYVAPPKVAYVNTGIFTMFASSRSTNADRANLLKMIVGFLQGASATTATGILANTAAGDAWKNSVLPGPLTFVNAVPPA